MQPVLKFFGSFILIVSLTACGATRTLKPLGEGNSQIDVSVGGPMITQGVSIPAPYSSVGYSYGIHEKLNLEAAFHPTAAIYKTFGMEVGALAGLVSQDGAIPEVALNARVAVGADLSNAAAFPILSPVISYDWSGWSPYVGMDHLFQLHDNDRAWTPQILAPFLGARYQGTNWLGGAEVKWAAINHDLKYNNVDHPKALGSSRGALAPHLFLGYRF